MPHMDAENKNPNEEELRNLIQEIRKWMEEKFQNPRTDDYYLLRFIEACKYRTEKIKHKLECDYHFRRKTPEWYENRDPEGDDVKELFLSGVAIFPEIRDEKGRRMIIVRPCHHDIKFSGDNYYKCVSMCFDEVMEKDPTITSTGTVVIVDLDGISLTHCLKKTMTLKKCMYWWLNTMAMRIQEIHFLRMPYYGTYFFNIIKNCLSEKMRKRLIIHTDVSDLQKFIDPEFLPVEYYGTNGSINDLADSYAKNVFEKRQWFLNYSFKN